MPHFILSIIIGSEMVQKTDKQRREASRHISYMMKVIKIGLV